jgi:hypothetical protein
MAVSTLFTLSLEGKLRCYYNLRFHKKNPVSDVRTLPMYRPMVVQSNPKRLHRSKVCNKCHTFYVFSQNKVVCC